MSDYTTRTELIDYIKSSGSNVANPDTIDAAITAASRAVDSYCGRRFYSAWEVQYFRVNPDAPSFLWILTLDDMDLANLSNQTTPGSGTFEVATEQGNDGAYATVWTPNTDFIAEPINQSKNGITGWPYTYLRAIGGKVWPINFLDWQRPTVRITANFGWTDTPEPVVQATKILASQLWKLGEAPLGVAGWGAYGDIKVREIPQAAMLLNPYRRAGTGSLGIA